MTADRPEHELLRLSITRRFTPPTDASIPGLLDRVEDWTYLLELARRQHVLPLLQDCLSTNGRRAGPQAVFWTLAQAVAMIQARNRQLARELVRLHRAAADAHIRLLSFKGPVLAAAYYGDIGLRQFGDLDVLVDRASSDRAEELFAGLGYRRARDFGFEVSLINARRRIAVDLHRAVSADNFPIALEFDGLWERREKVELGHGCAETLSTPDLVLVIGVEAARDARQGKAKLGKMSDLVHVLRALTDTEWAQIEREARRLDVRRVLWFASELASSLLRMPAPRQVDLDAPPARLIPFLRETEARVFHAQGAPPPSRRRGDVFHFHLRERWRDKLFPYALRVHRLVTPNVHDRSVIALPTALKPLYYLVRPVRLLIQYGGPRLRQARLAARASLVPGRQRGRSG